MRRRCAVVLSAQLVTASGPTPDARSARVDGRGPSRAGTPTRPSRWCYGRVVSGCERRSRTCCSQVRGGTSPHHASARSPGGTVLPERTTSAASIARSRGLSGAVPVSRGPAPSSAVTEVSTRENARSTVRAETDIGWISGGADLDIRSRQRGYRRPDRRPLMKENRNEYEHHPPPSRSCCCRRSAADHPPRSGSPPANTAPAPAAPAGCDRPATARSDADRKVPRSTRRPGRRGDRAGDPGGRCRRPTASATA